MLRVTMALRVVPCVTLCVTLCVTMALLAPWAATAQVMQGTPPGSGSNSTNNSTNGNGGNSSTSTRSTPPPADSGKPVFLSGRVLLSDGNPPAEGVAVQRVCGASVTTQQTQTDSKGRFTLQVGGKSALVPEASSSSAFRTGDAGGGNAGRGSNTAASAWGCDLRAVLQGYRSDTLPLNDRHAMDDPNVGTILPHPLVNKGQGLSVSATSGFAPKSARQAYQKGLGALRHNSPEKAQKDFLRAVDLYPRFAVAWFELGQTYERRAHTVEARDAYTKAVAADGNYVNPYERLYLLDLTEGRWQQAADTSEKVLRLDPIDFPRAYYFNALANAHLQNLAAAERSAREATKLEGPAAEPRAHYILGLVLASRGNLTGAADSLRVIL